MTTVGYGDIVPKTVTSKVLLCIFGVVGTGFIALPAVCYLKTCDAVLFLILVTLGFNPTEMVSGGKAHLYLYPISPSFCTKSIESSQEHMALSSQLKALFKVATVDNAYQTTKNELFERTLI